MHNQARSALLSFPADLVQAVRNLRKSRSFATVAVLTLAIGLSANTAIFSVVNAVLLRPLAFRDPGRLVVLHEDVPVYQMRGAPVSTIEYLLLKTTAKSYQDLGAYESVSGELSGVTNPETLSGARVTASLLSTLGVPAQLGRTFNESEDFDGSSAVVLSYRLWMRDYSGDRSIVGRTISIDRKPLTVVGVMPAGFVFPLRGPADNNVPADYFLPMGFTAVERAGRGPILQKSVIGRLKDGVTLQAAQAETATIVPAMAASFPPTYLVNARKGMTFSLVPLQQEVTGGISRVLWMLMAAVAVLLLIASANVANLSLTRSTMRRREFAVRAALGASRAVLLRLSIAESLAIALLGALLGLAFAAWGKQLVAWLSPIQLPRAEEIRTDGSVVTFAFGAALVSALLAGIGASLQSANASPNEALQDSSRGSTAGRSRRRLVSALVSAQFAMTIMLLVASGLLLRSLANMLHADPGFQPAHAASVTTHVPVNAYPKAAQLRQLYVQIASAAEALPGVKAAGIGTELPLGSWEKGTIIAEHSLSAAPDLSSGPIASQVWVTGNYLQAIGVRLLDGRFFSNAEFSEPRGVVMISQSLASQLWPGEPAVGRRLRNSRNDWLTVIGVVSDVREVSLNTAAVAQIYEPHTQLPDRLLELASIPFFRTLNLVARSSTAPEAQIRQLVSVAHHADPLLAVSDSMTFADLVQES